jgi:ubiquinone biosynthesis protein Coq4
LLNLRLVIEGQWLAFRRQETGEKLLMLGELADTLRQKIYAHRLTEERAKQPETQLFRMKEQLRTIEVDPDTNRQPTRDQHKGCAVHTPFVGFELSYRLGWGVSRK